jgi:hypothetical protein
MWVTIVMRHQLHINVKDNSQLGWKRHDPPSECFIACESHTGAKAEKNFRVG